MIKRGYMSGYNKHTRKNFSILVNIFCGVILCFLFPDVLAADIAQPILKATQKITSAGLKIGKAIASISFLGFILMLIMGKPQWKWAAYIMLGGSVLTGFSNVVNWVVG